MTAAARHPWTLFLGGAACVYAAVLTLAYSPVGSEKAHVLAPAALFDLAITVPLLAYWLLVRPGRMAASLLLPMVGASYAAAWLVLPAAVAQHLPPRAWGVSLLELVTVAVIVYRVRRGWQQRSGAADPLERYREAALATVPVPAAARVVAGEIATFAYAFGRPQWPVRGQTFACGEASGAGLLAMLICCVVPLEGVALHLLLQRWSPLAAWLMSVLDLYALVWAVALYRSVQARPVLVDEQTVRLGLGMMWTVVIPREQIAVFRPAAAGETEQRHPETLRLTVLQPPQFVLELREPVLARGLYGNTRHVRRVLFAVDQPTALAAALRGE